MAALPDTARPPADLSASARPTDARALDGATALMVPPLADLRGEIDALDDAMLDLLLRRAAVVERLAASRSKGGSVPLRPGREALILRRLLARQGRGDGAARALPAATVVRLWREIFAASTLLQAPFAVALFARRPEHERLARDHFGTLTPLRSHPTPARALAAVAAGEAAIAVLPLPQEAEPPADAWWLSLDSPRLQVVARLPFWSAGAEPGPEVLAVGTVAPDSTGQDRALLRIETVRSGGGPELSRAHLMAALRDAGLPPSSLLLQRDAGGLRGLAEVAGLLAPDDPRLKLLPVDRALPLGGYAIPIRGPARGD